MSDFVSLGIVILSGVAFASLQVNLGCLLLLYHSSVGKHVTIKTRTLVTGYILGVSAFLLLSIFAGCFLIYSTNNRSLELWEVSALAGALIATALLVWLIYYRFGGATELWLPRSVSKFLSTRAKSTNSPVEAFSLGMMSCFAEIPFSVALIIVAANSILSLSLTYQYLFICIFVLISILPLLCLRLFLRKGTSVVSVQRWRTRNKTFLRIFSGFVFLSLSIFIFVFEVMGGL